MAQHHEDISGGRYWVADVRMERALQVPRPGGTHSCATQVLLPIATKSDKMTSSHSICLSCPVPQCTRQFTTERAKDCLRVHLRYSKDKDHNDIYIARYSDHQKKSTSVYTCPICPQAFAKKSRLKRHYEGLRKYLLDIESANC